MQTYSDGDYAFVVAADGNTGNPGSITVWMHCLSDDMPMSGFKTLIYWGKRLWPLLWIFGWASVFVISSHCNWYFALVSSTISYFLTTSMLLLLTEWMSPKSRQTQYN